MGRSGITEKTPSGSISALMRWWGVEGVGIGTRQPLLPGSPQKAQDLGLLDKSSALNYTPAVGGVWPQLFLQDLPQETKVPSLHGYPDDLATLPIRYELHQRGRKCAHYIS